MHSILSSQIIFVHSSFLNISKQPPAEAGGCLVFLGGIEK